MTAEDDELSRERFGFTVFLSACVHAIIILGVGFTYFEELNSEPALEITMAQYRSEIAPDDADFLAQENQIGSGVLDEAAWDAFFALREQVNTALDQAKKDKVVGSSIAAAVTVPGLSGLNAEAFGEPWEQLFIVAKVSEGDALGVVASEGVKCPRCWNVGAPAQPAHEVHSELCPRCFNAVT